MIRERETEQREKMENRKRVLRGKREINILTNRERTQASKREREGLVRVRVREGQEEKSEKEKEKVKSSETFFLL